MQRGMGECEELRRTEWGFKSLVFTTVKQIVGPGAPSVT